MFCFMIIPGIVGRGDTKLICGIRIAGMNLRARKEDKVDQNHLLGHFLWTKLRLNYWSYMFNLLVGAADLCAEIQLKMQFI